MYYEPILVLGFNSEIWDLKEKQVKFLKFVYFSAQLGIEAYVLEKYCQCKKWSAWRALHSWGIKKEFWKLLKIGIYPFWAFFGSRNFLIILWVRKKNYIFGIRTTFSLYPENFRQFWDVSLPKVRDSYREWLLSNIFEFYPAEVSRRK